MRINYNVRSKFLRHISTKMLWSKYCKWKRLSLVLINSFLMLAGSLEKFACTMLIQHFYSLYTITRGMRPVFDKISNSYIHMTLCNAVVVPKEFLWCFFGDRMYCRTHAVNCSSNVHEFFFRSGTSINHVDSLGGKVVCQWTILYKTKMTTMGRGVKNTKKIDHVVYG